MLWNVLGSPKEPGILPRVLDATFRYIGGRLYEAMDLKPYLRNDAQYLDPDQVKQERSAKAAIFASVKEVRACSQAFPKILLTILICWNETP